MHFRNLVSALAVFAAVVPLWPAPVFAQGRAPLFEESNVVQLADAPARDGGPRVIRSRVARLRPAQLDAALTAGLAGATTPVLDLNLFADTTLRGVFERLHTDRLGHQTWVGRVDGDRLSTITVTWRGDTVVGAVQTRDAVYRLSGTMNSTVVEQVDPASFGEERDPLPVAVTDAATAAPGHPEAAHGGAVVDVLVYYTTAAKTAQGGRAGIEALIATAVADANTAYGRSGLSVSIRLAAAAELPGYVESSDMSNDLSFIRTSATVAAGRNAVGADLVSLVVASSTGGACGVGYLGPSAAYAHSVTARSCILGNYTFAHELGHNFGSHHAPEDGAGGAWKPYGYGYKDVAAGFRTVMAYSPGTRVLNFSSPAILHAGRVTGTSGQNNALSLSESFLVVEGFRIGGTPPPPPPPPSVTSAPLNVAASANGSIVTVSWSAPATGVATGYWVRIGTAVGAWNVFDGAVGLVSSVSSPMPNGTYFARVYAENAAGFSAPSADVPVSVNVGPSMPGPPRSLVGAVAGSVVNVSWSPPNSGGPVASYVARVGTFPGGSNVFDGSVGTATGASGVLSPGTYYVRVHAQNAVGLGAPSNELVVTVGPVCSVPAAPVLQGSRSGNTISVNWSTPPGGPVAGYTLQVGSVSGASNLVNGSVGLTNGVSATVGAGSYFIRVIANAACGSGATSNQLSIAVP